MTRANREDMVVISMGLNALLDCVRQTEAGALTKIRPALLAKSSPPGHALFKTKPL